MRALRNELGVTLYSILDREVRSQGGAGLLAIALLPMSGLAVVMVRDTATLYPGFGKELAAVVLSAVAVLELVGPLATQFALKRAGEAHPESSGA